MASRADAIPMGGTAAPKIWGVILASSVGTMLEWYDFYIFGSLAVVLSQKFYPPGNATFAFIAYLSTFAIGFMVRPFGALFFGRIGDLVGRKYAFLITLTVMGFGTFLIGLMPTYATAGWKSSKAHHCERDRKSTRLNSSHVKISYAVFCLKKKKKSARCKYVILRTD